MDLLKKFTFMIFFFFLSIQLGQADEFILMTTLYNEKNKDRISEYEYVLNKNLNTPSIKKIIIFFEGYNEYSFINKILEKNSEFLEIIPISSRPSFSSLFNYANENFRMEKIIIANADIYFDETLELLTNAYLADSFISLNRYDKLPDRTVMFENGLKIKGDLYSLSADAWIFSSPIEAKISEEFLLGTSACEKFLNEILKYNIKLKNPAFDIKAYHVHNSNIRNYKSEDQYPNYPFVFVKATKLIDKPKILIKRLKASEQYKT